MNKLVMKYNTPAQDSDYGWENESLPIGNGFTGANIFGVVERERIQITHNSLTNPQYYYGKNFGGLNNFAEIYIHFPHSNCENYERGLDLDNAVSYVKYTTGGVLYEREYIASYPDRIVAMRFKSSVVGALSFDLKPEIPFIKDFALEEGDGGGKKGTVAAFDNRIILKGTLEFFNVRFEGQFVVMCDGEISAADGSISVKSATDATIYFVADTNYELSENVFLENDPKKKIPDIDPHDKVSAIMESALKYNYDELKKRHIEDYSNLFGRVSLSVGDTVDSFMPELFEKYRNGESVPYLEMLYFQFGRYL